MATGVLSSALRLVRFFHVVPPVPRLMVATMAAATAAGVVLIVLRPGSASSSLIPILLLQLFAASSGFSVPARRGHYDLLVTLGETRLRIAAAHWVMSIAPGVAGWCVLAATEIVAVRGTTSSVTASGSLIALLITSTVPWACTVSLPRFAAAIGWLLVLATAAVSLPGERVLRVFSTLGGGDSWLEAVLGVLTYPPILVGESVAGGQAFIAGPALIVAAVAMVQAFRWIHAHDIPLETAQ